MRRAFLILLWLVCNSRQASAQFQAADSLQVELAKAPEDSNKANLLCRLGILYAFSQADSAIHYATEALDLSRKINHTNGEAFSSFVLSMSLTLSGNSPAGLRYAFDFLALAKKINNTGMVVNALDLLAICYREQQDYSEALRYAFEAEAITRIHQLRMPFGWLTGLNLPQRAFVLGTICSIYEQTNQLDSALYYGKKSAELTGEWSGLYLKLGNTYFKLGQPDSALRYYRMGLPLAEKHRIYIDLVDMYNKMSDVFESTGNMDSSIYYAHKSIEQEGASTYPEGRLRASEQLADLCEKAGLKDSVNKYLRMAVGLRQVMFDREKTRETQRLAFYERTHQQDLVILQEKERNRIRTLVLIAIIAVFLVIAFIQWRNNKQRQKAKARIEQAYAELKATQAQLVQSEKMASLGELTAGIAHEIQNPLNFVNNFSELNQELVDELKHELETGNAANAIAIAHDIKENEEKILQHGRRADGIVKSMLQHSRSSSGIKEPTDINELADEYLRLAYHGLRAKDKSFHAKFETDFDKAVGKIRVVPQDIGRVVLNLISNAFYSVNEKQAQGIQGYEPTVTVRTKKLPGKVEIRIMDNGKGIPQKVFDKIFQPFFTTKPTGEGTGLGLSLSYDIVTKGHGGQLKAETKEGEGATFIILLPDNQ